MTGLTAKQFIAECKKDRCSTMSRSKSKKKKNNFSNKYTKELGKQGYPGIKKDGYFTKFYPYGVVGHCCIGVQAHFIWAGLDAFVPKFKSGKFKYIWNTNVYHSWLRTNPTIKGYGKVHHTTDIKKVKPGAVAFTPSHTCLVRFVKGDYVHTVDFNVGGKGGINNGSLKKRHKSKFNGFANMPYPEKPVKKIEVKKTTPKKTTTTYKVATSRGKNLRIRQNDSVTSKQIGLLKYGSHIEVSKISGKWAYVPAKKGWVAVKYIKKI